MRCASQRVVVWISNTDPNIDPDKNIQKMLAYYTKTTHWKVIYKYFPRYDSTTDDIAVRLRELEECVNKYKRCNINKIILPPQTALLDPFIRGDELGGRRIKARHNGINFFVADSGASEINSTTNIYRFIDANFLPVPESIYKNVALVIILQTNDPLTIYFGNLYKTLALDYGISEGNINVRTLSSQSDYDNAVSYIQTTSNSITDKIAVVHFPIFDFIPNWTNTFEPILNSDTYSNLIHIGGNYEPDRPINTDIIYGSTSFSFPPVQLNIPGLNITKTSVYNETIRALYYQMLKYISSGGTYKMEYNNLRFDKDNSAINMWVGDVVIKKGELTYTTTNVNINDRWIDNRNM